MNDDDRKLAVRRWHADLLKSVAGPEDQRDQARETMLRAHEALKSSDEAHGPRYHCLDCQDTGCVPVIQSGLMLRLTRSGGLDEFNESGERLKLVNMACHCRRGKGLAEGVSGPKYDYEPLPVFDPDQNFRCLADTPEAREELRRYIVGEGEEVEGPIWVG